MKEKGRIIINAENAVLGRLASYSAKQALQNKEVIIVNSEKAIIIGREKDILERYRKRIARGGPESGPFFQRGPAKILKRTIRNMLSYKQFRGREALKRIKCYISIPKVFENEKMIKSGKGKKGISLDKLSKSLKGR